MDSMYHVVVAGVACLIAGLLTASFTLFLRLCLQGKGMILNWYYSWLLSKWEQKNRLILKPLGLCFWCYGSWVAVFAWSLLVGENITILCAILGANYLFLGLLHGLKGLQP